MIFADGPPTLPAALILPPHDAPVYPDNCPIALLDSVGSGDAADAPQAFPAAPRSVGAPSAEGAPSRYPCP